MDQFLHNLDWVLPLRSRPVTLLMEAASALGYTAFFFVLLPLLYWAWNREKANRIAIALFGSGLLTFFLKDLFADPRPPQEYWITAKPPTSFGLPSGHTLMAIVFWFSIAAELGKRKLFLVAGLVAGLIAFSRLYLGVHDMEDVLGGLLGGSVFLVFLRLAFKKTPLAEITNPVVLTLVGGFTAALIFWPADAPPGRSFLVLAFTIGWSLGFTLLNRRVRTATTDSKGDRIIRCFLGLILVALIAAALRFGLPLLSLPAPWNLIVGGFMIGLTITLLVPVLVQKIRSSN